MACRIDHKSTCRRSRPRRHLVLINYYTECNMKMKQAYMVLALAFAAGSAAAATTDLLDGPLARRFGGSRVGTLIDPIADRAFVLAGANLGTISEETIAEAERELGLEVVTVDVSDMHVVGPRPILVRPPDRLTRGFAAVWSILFR